MRKLSFALAALLLLATGYLFARPADDLPIFKKPSAQGEGVNPTITARATPGTFVRIGDDMALRIEGEYQGRVVGTLMVRKNGRWSEVILGGNNVLTR